jgi:hypothetical protein
MKLTVTMVDHAPAELDEQAPFTFSCFGPSQGQSGLAIGSAPWIGR